MLLFRLWRNLQTPPPAHISTICKTGENLTPRWLRILLTLSLIPFIPAAIFLYLILPLQGFMLNASAANQVAMLVDRERRQRTYELLCLAPGGRMAANWSLFAGFFHYHTNILGWSVGRMFRVFRWLSIALWLIIGVFISMTIAQFAADMDPAMWEAVWMVRILTVCISVFIFFDNVSAPITGGLIGIMGTTLFKESQPAAGTVAMLVHMGTYAVALIVGLGVIPILYRIIGLNEPGLHLLNPIAVVIVFILLQETLAQLLWRMLPSRLNATRDECNAILKKEKVVTAPFVK